jgi:hypothetical protein
MGSSLGSCRRQKPDDQQQTMSEFRLELSADAKMLSKTSFFLSVTTQMMIMGYLIAWGGFCRDIAKPRRLSDQQE